MGAVPEMSTTTTTSWKSRFNSRRPSKESNESEDSPQEQETSLSHSRRANRKGMRERLSRLIPASNHSQARLYRDAPPAVEEPPAKESPETKSSSSRNERLGHAPFKVSNSRSQGCRRFDTAPLEYIHHLLMDIY